MSAPTIRGFPSKAEPNLQRLRQPWQDVRSTKLARKYVILTKFIIRVFHNCPLIYAVAYKRAVYVIMQYDVGNVSKIMSYDSHVSTSTTTVGTESDSWFSGIARGGMPQIPENNWIVGNGGPITGCRWVSGLSYKIFFPSHNLSQKN